MVNHVKLKLWNPEKRGTLIIGDPRFGTHFLEKIVCHAVGDRCRRYREDVIGPETAPAVILERFQSIRSGAEYATLIVNHALQKTVLVSYPELLEPWHIIRVTHRDKIRWFISWWLFLYHERSAEFAADQNREDVFMHHGTPAINYLKHINGQSRIILDQDNISMILAALSNHLTSLCFLVDEEIDYSDLWHLGNDQVPWRENQYPTMNLGDIFGNAEILEKILMAWSTMDIQGRFKGPR